MLLKQRVDEAGRLAINELKDQTKTVGSKRRRKDGPTRDDKDRDDDIVEACIPHMKKSKRRH